jgi:rRNA maturation RNase YbeY
MQSHALLNPPLRELSVALVGDERTAKLHWDHMKIAGPTDVLTFELDHDGRGRVTSGEVIVCVPFAVRAAKAEKIPVRKELLLYALHGMLHLCGFDDRNDADFAQMHHREDNILKRLGVGAVFHLGRKKSRKHSGLLKTCPRPHGHILARSGDFSEGEGMAPSVTPAPQKRRRRTGGMR